MTEKILIIDDETDIRDYLMAVLEDHGYVTYGVDENESILEAVMELRPDLVVLDIMMPDRSGISVYRELRTTPETAHIPIALLTGVNSGTIYLRTAISQFLEKDSIPPPNWFIEKPIDIPVLLSSISSLFDERRDPPDVAP
ncbi:MAG: response regulator [Thermodesulfobacteriota bacterium]|nr:response regulator [Thermodesulfobacteriota bacterium]